MMEGTMQNSTLKKGDKIREALRPDMLDSHNHAPRTMYEGDNSESAYWRGKNEPMRLLHVEDLVGGHCV